MPHFDPSILEPWKRIHPHLTEFRHIPKANIVKHLLGYDERSDRIVFPMFWDDRLVGWQTRRIWNDGTPKYKNSPDFPRGRVLYNLDVKSPRLVIIEAADGRMS